MTAVVRFGSESLARATESLAVAPVAIDAKASRPASVRTATPPRAPAAVSFRSMRSIRSDVALNDLVSAVETSSVTSRLGGGVCPAIVTGNRRAMPHVSSIPNCVAGDSPNPVPESVIFASLPTAVVESSSCSNVFTDADRAVPKPAAKILWRMRLRRSARVLIVVASLSVFATVMVAGAALPTVTVNEASAGSLPLEGSAAPAVTVAGVPIRPVVGSTLSSVTSAGRSTAIDSNACVAVFQARLVTS